MTDIGGTRIIEGNERPWLPLPGYEGSYMKVLVVDEERKQVIFMFRMAPGATFPKHLHHCHAIAYTTAGEWQYEEGTLPVGAMAYEPVGSEHTPSSRPGCEMVVFLRSDDGRFLENYMDDGSIFLMDMAFFKMMLNMTPDEVAAFNISSASQA